LCNELTLACEWKPGQMEHGFGVDRQFLVCSGHSEQAQISAQRRGYVEKQRS
jgi:hypothetical protein